ncbi:hypothetical protein D3C71_1981410 [compost metagenome]
MQCRDPEDDRTGQLLFMALGLAAHDQPHQEVRSKRQCDRATHEECTEQHLDDHVPSTAHSPAAGLRQF